MECLKLQEDKPSPDHRATAVNGKPGETTEAPAVAEFLLALAQSPPTTESKKDANNITASNTDPLTTNNTKKLGGKIVRRAPGAPIRARPLPDYLALTRIPPLLFAEKLLRHENVPLEHYFPDQFDVEIENYVPSDHDIICGRGRGNFSHTGNQKLLDIIRERQEDYLKSNKRGKGALGKQILLEILMNGGRFVKLKEKNKDQDQSIWRVLSHKDVNTKIMHCIRDQINFQRKQTVAEREDCDGSRGTKHLLENGGFDASGVPPSKRLRQGGAKKLSSYLKMKHHNGDHNRYEGPNLYKSVLISPKNDNDVSRISAQITADLRAQGLAEAIKAAESSEARLEAATGQALSQANLLAAQKHVLAQAMGQGVNPAYHSLIVKKEAELAALRSAMIGDVNLAAVTAAPHSSMLQYSHLLPQFSQPALDLKQSMILARAEIAAAGLRDPIADRLRLAAAGMMNPSAESLMAEHLRQAVFQRNGMAGATAAARHNPLASLLGGLPAAQAAMLAPMESTLLSAEGGAATKSE